MEVKYGSSWQHIGAFMTTTFAIAKPLEDLFLLARSRRGGLGSSRALTHPTTLRRREEKLMQEDEEEKEESDDTGDIDLGSLLSSIADSD